MYFYLDINNNNFNNKENKLIERMEIRKKMNIFVGENNSGKSRFIKQIISSINECIVYKNISDNSNVISNINYIRKEIERKISNTIDLRKFQNECDKRDNNTELYHFLLNYAKEKSILINKGIIKNVIIYSEYHYLKETNFCKYIPILRGNENFNVYYPPKDNLYDIQMTIPQHKDFENYLDTAKTIYKNKTSNVYNINQELLFTGEELYDEITDILLGDENQREKFHGFEKFISDMFYESKIFQINPSKKKNCLLVKIGNSKEYEIHNMGEGIKQLITILYPIYMKKDSEGIFFIEEPEINLHPGFQRKLMEILIENFPKHKYFITTHSNHIIDIINFSDDVSLYKFKKNNEKINIEELDKSYITVLSELGVNSSASLLSNCTIWVEGISDRIYLKKYIDMCFKDRNIENKYKEGIHYSFVEYGGGNIVHWNFDETSDNTNQMNVKYLNHNVFLIVDNDGTSLKKNKDGSLPEKEKRKRRLNELMGDKFFELKSREIENLIKLEVLEETLKKDNELKELHRVRYNDGCWNQKFDQSLISKPSVCMGEFIDKTYNLPKSYADSYGKTIKSKQEFAIKVCKNINSWNDLSEQAQELANIVCDFINKNN